MERGRERYIAKAESEQRGDKESSRMRERENEWERVAGREGESERTGREANNSEFKKSSPPPIMRV